MHCCKPLFLWFIVPQVDAAVVQYGELQSALRTAEDGAVILRGPDGVLEEALLMRVVAPRGEEGRLTVCLLGAIGDIAAPIFPARGQGEFGGISSR